MKKRIMIFLTLISIPGLLCANTSFVSELKQAMIAYKVPTVGYAIIDNGRLVEAKTITIDKHQPVSLHTLFQAASISKSVTAYAALSLVSEGKIQLDKNANAYLSTWKIPENKFTYNSPVKVRYLLDMTSGASVSGFKGYSKGEKLPTNVELLNGLPPANNKPVRIFYQPGTHYFYSGGAFQILQQLVSDVTKQTFSVFMNGKILPLIGMKNSLYQYPLQNKRFLTQVVPGYEGWSGQPVQGGWRNYACAGAGGLWSTPVDLAKFALNVTASYLGKARGILDKKTARSMLTRQPNTDYGLGFVVAGSGDDIYFWKAGHNQGYHSLLLMFPKRGKG